MKEKERKETPRYALYMHACIAVPNAYPYPIQKPKYCYAMV